MNKETFQLKNKEYFKKNKDKLAQQHSHYQHCIETQSQKVQKNKNYYTKNKYYFMCYYKRNRTRMLQYYRLNKEKVKEYYKEHKLVFFCEEKNVLPAQQN